MRDLTQPISRLAAKRAAQGASILSRFDKVGAARISPRPHRFSAAPIFAQRFAPFFQRLSQSRWVIGALCVVKS
jgi:hypothetical protein